MLFLTLLTMPVNKVIEMICSTNFYCFQQRKLEENKMIGPQLEVQKVNQSINQSINQYKHKKGQTTHIWWRCQGPLPPNTVLSPHSGWTWLHSACLQSAQHNLTLNNSTIRSVVLPASHVPSLRHTNTLLGHQATNQQAKKKITDWSTPPHRACMLTFM